MAGSSQYGTPFVPYTITLLALSMLFTWLYRATGHSVLLAMILHASHNTAPLFIPFQPSQTGTATWLLATVLWLLGLGLVAVYGRDLRSTESDDRETVEERVSPVA